MARPKTPSNLYTSNGWYMELPGLLSPNFETVDGLGFEQESIMQVDAGSNLEYKFSSQVTSFTPLTMTRVDDGSSDDNALDQLVAACRDQGSKITATLVKLHYGVEVHRLQLIGFRFTGKTEPTWDINSRDKKIVTYQATVDYYYKL